MIGTLRIDEVVAPIVEIRLHQGAIMLRAPVEVTADNVDRLRQVHPGTMLMVFGDDGQLIARGCLGEREWPPPQAIDVGDSLNVHHWLSVTDKLTTRARAADAAAAARRSPE